jgi:hypothetical protein
MGNNIMCSLWKDNQRSGCLDEHVTSNFCAEEQAKQETSVKQAAGRILSMGHTRCYIPEDRTVPRLQHLGNCI